MSYSASESVQLLSAYGIYDRDLRKELDGKAPRFSALSWMRATPDRLGRRDVKNHKYDYWESEDHLNAGCTIAAANTGTANQVTITLSEEDHFQTGAKSYPVPNQLAVFEDETVGFVVSVNKDTPDAHTVTIYRQNADNDVQAAAVVGSSVVFYSNMQPEKSGATQGRLPRQVKISNYMQTFREYYEVTDHASQHETEFSKDGQRYLHIPGIHDTEDRFEMQEELGLLITPLANGVTDAAGNPVKSTYALIPQITDHGQTQEYFESPDTGDFDDAILQLNKSFADNEYVVGIGINLWLKLKNFVKDFGAQSPELFFTEMGQADSLKFGFKSIEVLDYKFNFSRWACLDHASSLGKGNLPYKDMAVFLPTGNTIDPNLNETRPYVSVAYAKPQGAPHQIIGGDLHMWETGAGAKTGATSDIETRAIHWVTYKGMEVRQRHKFMIWRKAA